ncbi:hypothetical protein M434DRAFT_149405 [Hypoxylon sp. CO27-5]|nr:hypothetical protein M434DRAFT_149405 [Hypoxylon sp. CO27-5]
MRRTPIAATLRWTFYFHSNISPSRQQLSLEVPQIYLSLKGKWANHRCSTLYPRPALGPKWSLCNHSPRLYDRAWINTSHPHKGVILATDFEFFRDPWPPTLFSFHFSLQSSEITEVHAGTLTYRLPWTAGTWPFVQAMTRFASQSFAYMTPVPTCLSGPMSRPSSRTGRQGSEARTHIRPEVIQMMCIQGHFVAKLLCLRVNSVYFLTSHSIFGPRSYLMSLRSSLYGYIVL